MKTFLKKHVHAWMISTSLAVLFLCIALIGSFMHLKTNQTPISDSSSKESQAEVVAVIYPVLASMSQEELIENSTLIVKAKLTDKSPAFQIKSVEGGISNFTDYYFEPENILRGEATTSSIAVRINEGLVGDTEVINDVSYNFEIGSQYILFLYAPSYGGGFTTEGDYYYVTGAQQGVYKLNSIQTRSGEETYQNSISEESNSIILSDFTAEVNNINSISPPQEDIDYQNFLDAQQENLESGFITQEEYNKFLQESQQYATILTDESS